MKNLFVLLLLCSYCTLCRSQASWTLIYENDAQGETLHGDLQDLVNAIRSGQPIRIYFIMGNLDQNEGYAEHAAEAPFLTVLNKGGKQVVYAQLAGIKAQVPSGETPDLNLHESLEWTLLAASNGKNEQMLQNPMSGEVLMRKTSRWGVQWYTPVE